VAPSQTVGVSASIDLPLHHKSRSSLLAPAHLGGPGKSAIKGVCVCVCSQHNCMVLSRNCINESMDKTLKETTARITPIFYDKICTVHKPLLNLLLGKARRFVAIIMQIHAFLLHYADSKQLSKHAWLCCLIITSMVSHTPWSLLPAMGKYQIIPHT